MPEWVQIIIRTLLAIFVLFVMTKLLGKRQVSQLSFFEYITGITIGDLAANISMDLLSNWYLGIISLTVWVSISLGIEALQLKSKKSRDWIDGKSTVLVEGGNILENSLRKERITSEELLEQLREKNIFNAAEVEFAVMEPSGKINVLQKKEHQPLTAHMLGLDLPREPEARTVILDGQILGKSLAAAGKDHRWLAEELKRSGAKADDVFLAQIDASGRLYLDMNDLRTTSGEREGK